MVVLRSGRNLETGSCSSIDSKHRSSTDVYDYLISKIKSIPTHSSPPLYCHNGYLESSSWRIRKKQDKRPVDKYTTQALDSYNQNSPQKYKLVELGGMTPVFMPQCTIFHLDFTAKNAHVARAPKEVFFAELIYIRGVLSDCLCECLGPISSISGDKLNGCRFCDFKNVQHPEGGGFVRGDDHMFLKTVQDICGINTNNAILDEEKNLPMLKHVNHAPEPKKEGEYTSEQVDDARPYSAEAVLFYNQLKHTNYELVDPGFITRVILPTCSLFHISFTAKKTDVADVPEEMFFAELTSGSGVLSFTLCVCMGPTDSITGDKLRDKLGGCYYCCKYNNVQHPRGGGFVRGGDSLYKKTPNIKITRDPALANYPYDKKRHKLT